MSKNNFFIGTEDKKPLVFLHGFGCDSQTFAYQIKFFSKWYKVYSPDLKGFGKNKDMPYPYCLNDYLRELKDYFTENGIVKPHIIAHSFGGRIALKLSKENGELIDKIVLTGSAGLKPKRTLKYRINKFKFNFLKLFVSKDKLKKYYSKDYLSLSPVMKKSFILIVNEYLDGALPFIKNPVFIINGSLDTETPLYTVKKLVKGIKNSDYYIMQGAGHFCFLENPTVFNLAVKEFLEKGGNYANDNG